MIKSILKLWTAALLLLFCSLPIHAETASGVLYFAEGGTGGGTMHFFTGKKLMRLRYMKDHTVMKGLDGTYRYGEKCTFTYHSEDGGFKLDSITFKGEFERPVQIGNDMVLSHYGNLFNGRYERAYKNLSPAWRKEQSLESFKKGFKSVKFKDPESAAVYATKVIGHSDREVLVLVNERYFVQGSEGYLRYTVRFMVEGGEPVWYIDSVKKIGFKEWQDS